MGLLSLILGSKTERAQQAEMERQRLLGKAFNRLLGEEARAGDVTTTTSSPLRVAEEFGARGNPIFTQDPNLKPSVRIDQDTIPATGFRGSDQGPLAQSKLLGDLLQSGATVAEATGLLSQIDQGDTANATLAQNTAVATAKKDKTIQDRTQSIRKERAKVIAPFLDTVNKIGQGLEGLKAGSGIGDLVAVVSVLKALDPTSVAREGEVDGVAKAAGVIEGLIGMINNAFGEGKLSPEARVQISEQLQSLYGRAAANAEGIDARFRDDAVSAGVDPLRLRSNASLFDEDNKIKRIKLLGKPSTPGAKKLTKEETKKRDDALLEKYK